MNFYCFSQLKEFSEFTEINIVTIHVIIRRKIYSAPTNGIRAFV
jgi:hypothetical protein